MLNILKWVRAKQRGFFVEEELKSENDYFVNNKDTQEVRLPCEVGFNPSKPNRLLKFVLGKDYHKFPDFLQSESTAKA